MGHYRCSNQDHLERTAHWQIHQRESTSQCLEGECQTADTEQKQMFSLQIHSVGTAEGVQLKSCEISRVHV